MFSSLVASVPPPNTACGGHVNFCNFFIDRRSDRVYPEKEITNPYKEVEVTS